MPKKKIEYLTETLIPVCDLQTGMYFKFEKGKAIYKVDCRTKKAIGYSNVNDIWGSYKEVNKTSKRLALVGFEY